MTVGKNIQIRRKELGWTQVELGRRVNKSAQVISNWERGYTTGITVDDITALSNALQVSTDYLLGRGDEKPASAVAHSAADVSAGLPIVSGYVQPNSAFAVSLADERNKPYYIDEETARIANEMKENPGRRVLFDASRKLSPESIKEVQNYIEFLYQKQDDSND